jgi:hypothetical protein
MKNPSSIRPCAAALLLVAAGFVPCAQTLRAQPADATTQALLDKAHDLEVHGHPDVAAQTWQQVLLTDPKNADALAGLARSAKLSGNPALANIYLERLRSINPGDANIARVTEAVPKQPATTTHTVVHAALEQEAYKALNARNLPGAETRFKAILAADPENAQALAGMGYIRLQQSNYDGAISFLEQAKHNGARDSALDSALESAHFNQLMGQGSDAFKENDLPTAEQRYRAALAMHSDNPQALEGLRVTLLKAQPQAAQHTVAQAASVAPPTIDIQNASLLFNAGDDSGLYRQLIVLGGRSDLSDEQRGAIQTIWTNWALRRANQAAASGDKKRSLAILIAAARSTPEDTVVIRALAAGCARSELPVQAATLFKSQDMTTATVADYRSAVGAALAAEDGEDAETWLHSGLEKYPKDPEMLFLAGKFERTRDDDIRAAGYFRATLAALPPGDPVAEVVAELSQPRPANHLATPAQNRELATLLSTPDSANGKSQLAESAQLSPPSYGNSADAQAQLQIPQQSASSQPLTNQPLGVYGTYVPYVAPTQISDNSSRKLPPQSEATETLPTARYTPKAPAAPNVAHLDLSSAPLAGQDTASAEDDSLTTPNAQYASRHHVSASSGISHGQQYPQPETRPETISGSTLHHRNSPTITAPTQSPNTQPFADQPRTTDPSSTPSSEPMSFSDAAQPNTIQTNLTQPNVARPTDASGSRFVGSPTLHGEPPSDAEVIARGEPALRGLYDANAPAGGLPPLSLRTQAQTELNSIEGSYSGWIGGTGYARYRTGMPGLDSLTDLEAPFEVSGVVGKAARVTIVTRPISLSNGPLYNTYFQNSGGTIPVLGTLPANALVAPPQQYASGIGGELQLTSRNYGLALGFTPYDFLVGNIIGRGQVRTFKGRLTFYGERDSVKDTELSYAGMRDPGSATPFSPGNIWGGVVSTGGGVRLDIGGPRARLYVSGDAAALTGTHVLENSRYGGQMGASFRVHHWPGHGALNVGGNFVGMHYEHNEQSMTYGQGGYFSPNVYFLGSVPVTYTGYYKNNFHYSIAGAPGVQSFQQAKAPYFPLDVPLQTDFNNTFTPATSNTSLSYSFNSEGAYLFNQHWFVGAFLAANNTNNYNNFSGGFFVRYLFKSQYTIEDYPTGMFPATGMRPLRVP